MGRIMLKLNGKEVKPTIFPDGTSQVWKLENLLDNNAIEWRWENKEEEFLHLAQLVTLLKKKGRGTIELWMPYLPYARQDKFIHNNECFALRAFGNLLNSLEFDRVSSFDAHSDVAGRVIKNFHSVSADALIKQLVKDYDTVCYPDLGAQSRYRMDNLCNPIINTRNQVANKQFLIGGKVRDQSTGRITSYKLNREPVEDEKVLVVDDLCDGGATFVLLGQELQKYHVQADLYVSHGIFSKGLDELKKYYNKIYTTDSLPTKFNDLTVFVTPRD